MLLFDSLQQAHFKDAWLAIGMFDGVHVGHQKILRNLSAGAQSEGVPALALTFFPHPAEVLRGPVGAFYLTDPAQKMDQVSRLGVDGFITQAFDLEFSKTRAEDYVRELKQALGLRKLVVGENFAMGHNREGDVPQLQDLGKTLGFEVEVASPVEVEGSVVSSSRIRDLLNEGRVTEVRPLLGRPFALTGKVVHGAGRGQELGIPTANIEIWPKHALPAWGIYVSKAKLGDQTWGAVTSIGVRPTFDEGLKSPVVETLLLDYQGRDFYGEELKLDFVARLRGEEKFDGAEALIAQIEQDILRGREILASA